MTFIATAIGAGAGALGLGGLSTATGAILGSSIGGLLGANRASSAQSGASDAALALQKEQFDKQMALQQPYNEAGLTAQNRLLSLLGIGGDKTSADYGKYGRDFSMADYQADPGYSFRLSEGLKGLDRQAAARGGLISGAALKAATRYGQDMGSQEYQNAFTRYQTNRANQLQPLGNLLNTGQAAASGQAAAAGNYGVNAGNTIMGGGDARASGYVGGANAITSGLGSYLNYTQGQNALASLRPSSYPTDAQMTMPIGGT